MGREPLPAKCVPCILSPKVNICAVVEQMLDYSPGCSAARADPPATPPSHTPEQKPATSTPRGGGHGLERAGAADHPPARREVPRGESGFRPAPAAVPTALPRPRGRDRR